MFIEPGQQVRYEVIATYPDNSTEVLDSGIAFLRDLEEDIQRVAHIDTVKYHLFPIYH